MPGCEHHAGWRLTIQFRVTGNCNEIRFSLGGCDTDEPKTLPYGHEALHVNDLYLVAPHAKQYLSMSQREGLLSGGLKILLQIERQPCDLFLQLAHLVHIPFLHQPNLHIGRMVYIIDLGLKHGNGRQCLICLDLIELDDSLLLRLFSRIEQFL